MRSSSSTSAEDSQARSRPLVLWVVVGALLILIGLLKNRNHETKWARPTETARPSLVRPSSPASATRPFSLSLFAPPTGRGSAEEIVARKLAQFGQSRLQLAQALSNRHNVEVSNDAQAFFAAIQSGKWAEIERTFNRINGGDSSAGHASSRPPEIQQIWPAIIDAYGAAEQVHLLPAQRLLDYGRGILDSLGPGMVYVGGTDAGRWVPELLNETSEGERHIVITQNGLADASYLDYVRLQFDNQMANITAEESERVFHDYIADAQKRLEHDQAHPEEAKQIRPGEQVAMADGKTQVSGQVAVMAINEKLLQTLMQKNPDLTFAVQESFPLKGTYPGALPLGPIMELGPVDPQRPFTEELATKTVGLWRNAAEELLADSAAYPDSEARKIYSHDMGAAANLLAARDHGPAAEEIYRLASEVWPANPEPVAALSELLVRSGRTSEAQELVAQFSRQFPDQRKALEQAGVSFSVQQTQPSPVPVKP